MSPCGFCSISFFEPLPQQQEVYLDKLCNAGLIQRPHRHLWRIACTLIFTLLPSFTFLNGSAMYLQLNSHGEKSVTLFTLSLFSLAVAAGRFA